MSTLLQVNDVTKRYGPRVVLDRCRISFAEGQKVGVIGRNGAGKSTLVRIIVGDDEADEGNVTRHSSLAALGFDIALVAQGDVAFIGNATVGGAILAHEQIDYRGTAESWGAVVAVDACNTLGSPISRNTTSSTSGDSTINFAGPLKTPFTASTLRAEVVGWYEL